MSKELDKLIRHAVYMRGQGTRIDNELADFLDDLEADVLKKLRKQKGLKDPTQLNNLLKEIDRLIVDSYEQYLPAVIEQLVELGEYQSEYMMGALNNMGAGGATLLSAKQIQAIVRENPIDGKLISEWVQEQEDGVKMAMRQQLRLGIAQGETEDQLAERLSEAGFEKARRHRRTLARTAAHSVSTAASIDTQKSAGVRKVQFVAVLDGRTTLGCADFDGNVYDLDDPRRPRLPRHPNCRSEYVPVVDGETFEGNFEEWLERQSEKDKKEILGPARYQLYKKGMKLSGFVDSEGNTLPLAELRKREAQ